MRESQALKTMIKESEQKLFSRMNIGQALKRNKKLFISVFLFFWLFSSTITLLSYKPAFVSKGMVIIKDTALTAKYVTGDSYETTTSQATSSVINTMGLLSTNKYMKNLWEFFTQKHPEELGKIHVKKLSDWEAYFEDGGKFIEYSNFPGTDIIEVKFKWNDPVIAQECLSIVLDTFRDLSLQLNRKEQHEREQFLAAQIADIQKKLVSVRHQISQYKKEHQIVDTVEENANLARARVNLKTDLEAAKAEAAGKRQQVSGYQQLLGMSPRKALIATAVGRNEVLSKLHSELYSAKQEQNFLLTRYTEANAKVQEVNSRISQLENNIRQELIRTVGTPTAAESWNKYPAAVADNTRSEAISSMLSAKTAAMDLNAKAHVLKSYLTELNNRARNLSDAEATLAAYKLEEASLDESLRVLHQKKLDAQLKESQTLSNVFVVEEPNIPIKPVFPTQKVLLALDLTLAIGLGFLAVLLRACFVTTRVQNDSNPEQVMESIPLKLINSKKPYGKHIEAQVPDYGTVSRSSQVGTKRAFLPNLQGNQDYSFPGLPSLNTPISSSKSRNGNLAELSPLSQTRRK